MVGIEIFSFFSGAGFLDLGFEKAGFSISFVNEIHEPFMRAYKHSRQKMGLPFPENDLHLNSVTHFLDSFIAFSLQKKIKNIRNKGSLVGFIGGPPCPDFSVGGKNRGKDGQNGMLSQSYASLICEQKPDFFLFENVKGLWRTTKHREFYNKLKKQFQDAGYVLFDKLINSLDYGVPQDRERIILLGFKMNGFNCFFKKPFLFKATQDLKRFNWPNATDFKEDSKLPSPKNIPLMLTVEHWFKKNKVTLHPNSIHYFKPKAGLSKFQSILEGDDSKKSYKRLHRWRFSPTACYGNNEVHLHPYKARRLTVSEALAIQSLPSEYELPESMTLTDMFKTVGNGVPYLVAYHLAVSIGNYLGMLYDENNSFKYS